MPRPLSGLVDLLVIPRVDLQQDSKRMFAHAGELIHMTARGRGRNERDLESTGDSGCRVGPESGVSSLAGWNDDPGSRGARRFRPGRLSAGCQLVTRQEGLSRGFPRPTSKLPSTSSRRASPSRFALVSWSSSSSVTCPPSSGPFKSAGRSRLSRNAHLAA